jgi:hypothetical protein
MFGVRLNRESIPVAIWERSENDFCVPELVFIEVVQSIYGSA